MGEEGLGIVKLLDATYSKITERHNLNVLTFQNTTLSEIANDSDWHRAKIGYMCYSGASLFSLGERTWAIALGTKGGDYPGDMYVGDIIALDLILNGKSEDDIKKELSERISSESYFMNTLFVGARDGNLGAREERSQGIPTRFGKRMVHVVSPRIKEFVLQTPEYDHNLILASTLQHPTTKVMLYKPETPDFLANCIEQVLRETN